MKNKSGGVDNIHGKKLKIFSEHISVPLEYIFNISVMAGASERTEPPDRCSNEKYKCCQKTNVKTIRCIFCGAAYHVGHIKYINGARRIDDSLIICEDHADLDLTSKVDHMFESVEFRTTIAQIKLEAKNALRQELLVEVLEKT